MFSKSVRSKKLKENKWMRKLVDREAFTVRIINTVSERQYFVGPMSVMSSGDLSLASW